MRDAMRSDQVAQLAVALCAPDAKETTGQVFLRAWERMVLFNQPRAGAVDLATRRLVAGDPDRTSPAVDEGELHRPRGQREVFPYDAI